MYLFCIGEKIAFQLVHKTLSSEQFFFNFFDSAALRGHFEVIRVLAAYGADLGKVASDGNTPLHHAAQQGFGPICKFLAQRGESF